MNLLGFQSPFLLLNFLLPTAILALATTNLTIPSAGENGLNCIPLNMRDLRLGTVRYVFLKSHHYFFMKNRTISLKTNTQEEN